MDAFESIVALFLEKKGYWVIKSVKVKLTPNEKESIGGRSMPTPEVDLVAYKPEMGLVLIEVKSFLDSSGVVYEDVVGTGNYKQRYKLLNNDTYREVISKRIYEDFSNRGLILKDTPLKFALAAGKIYKNEAAIKSFLNAKGDLYFSPSEISMEIRNLDSTVYLNDTATLTVKLLRDYFK